MKNLLVAVTLASMTFSSFGASVMKSDTHVVKFDKKKKKSKKRSRHGKCEAYNG